MKSKKRLGLDASNAQNYSPAILVSLAQSPGRQPGARILFGQ
jgi:hypothetical protein